MGQYRTPPFIHKKKLSAVAWRGDVCATFKTTQNLSLAVWMETNDIQPNESHFAFWKQQHTRLPPNTDEANLPTGKNTQTDSSSSPERREPKKFATHSHQTNASPGAGNDLTLDRNTMANRAQPQEHRNKNKNNSMRSETNITHHQAHTSTHTHRHTPATGQSYHPRLKPHTEIGEGGEGKPGEPTTQSALHGLQPAPAAAAAAAAVHRFAAQREAAGGRHRIVRRCRGRRGCRRRSARRSAGVVGRGDVLDQAAGGAAGEFGGKTR